MRSLFAALVGFALALLQAWAGPACACEPELRQAVIGAACCCGDEHGTDAAPCQSDCASEETAAPAADPPLPPGPSLDLLAPVAELPMLAEGAELERWRPTLARGPPGIPPPIWLRDQALLR